MNVIGAKYLPTRPWGPLTTAWAWWVTCKLTYVPDITQGAIYGLIGVMFVAGLVIRYHEKDSHPIFKEHA